MFGYAIQTVSGIGRLAAVERVAPVFLSIKAGEVALFVVQVAPVTLQVLWLAEIVQFEGETVRFPVGFTWFTDTVAESLAGVVPLAPLQVIL